ncbi:MAG: GlsB/YeaQ/YmgE family stress response membrane protein [bacterium]|nr:GlsB/YeaQ/YmgE family stress response membrane protein [bacterium]
MTAFFNFLLLLLIAGVCGSVAKALTGYSHGGCLASIALGFIGALLGGWLARVANLPDVLQINIGGEPFSIVWSIIGAVLFSLMLGLLTKRSPPKT